MMMGFGLVGLLLMVLFWGTLIVGAVWLLKSIFPDAGAKTNQKEQALSAREILDQRYARGEITRDEYIRMVEDVRGSL